MKAIVLTCDKYLKFADHMLYTYQKVWPSNPFTFRIPYGDDRSILDQYGSLVEPIQTDAAKVIHPIETESGTKRVSLIRDTVLTLLEDLPDDEWIYWCMDDRYLIKVKEKALNDIYNFVQNNNDLNLISVNFLRSRKGGYFKSDKFFKPDVNISTNEQQNLKEVITAKSIIDMWGHQFMRVKALRRVFLNFPDRPFLGKEMDSFSHPKLIEERQYVVENNLVVLGESTSRGEITENCAASFKKWGLELPSDMNISIAYHIIGELPHNFLGVEYKLPKKLQGFVTSVNRYYWRQRVAR
jgi:hypothetical protein